MLVACSGPVESEQGAIEKASSYIQRNYELDGGISNYRIKVWNQTDDSPYSLYSVYFVHESKYDDYANEEGEIVDAYAAIHPESFHVDVYSRNGEIEDLTYDK